MIIKDFIDELKNRDCEPVKKLKKKGTLDIGIVESTPVVFKGRLYRFEWIRPKNVGDGYYGNNKEYGYFRFTDMETEESSGAFAYDHGFGSAFTDKGVLYAVGVEGRKSGGHKLNMFTSKDMVNWHVATAIDFPSDWTIYNTSICKGADGYVMAIEIGAPKTVAGKVFTMVFAHSKNMADWELYDTEEYVYTKERYSACPVIRYVDGYYYMIYLEALYGHRFVPYIVRSRDLLEWELGINNPVMWYDDRDKEVQKPEKFTEEQLSYIKNAVDINNSDVDICEWKGKTVILYSWGNQLGKEFLAEAEYKGSMEEFLKSFF